MRAAPVSKIFLLAVAAAFRSGPAPSHRLTPRVRRVSGLGADGDRGRSVVFVRDATTRVAVSSRSVEGRNPNTMACVAQIRGVPAAAPRLSLLGNRRAGASPRPEDSRPIVAPPGWI